jgi:glycosyltransferase involved in cell wall biosynthesis
MRIVAATRIRDEEDIIEPFVRHTAAYVSHHVFVDNGSTDRTIEILRHMKDEGFNITVFENEVAWFYEHAYNTYLYKAAVLEYKADWVIYVDADEFIDDRVSPGGLASVLGGVRPEIPCVRVVLTNYTATPDDNENELIVPVRITKKYPPTDVGKVIVRNYLVNRDVLVDDGNHTVHIDGGKLCAAQNEPSVTLAHYNQRSPYLGVSKFIRGWAKVLATGDSCVKEGTSNHYTHPFVTLRDRPQDLLRTEWFRSFYTKHASLVSDPIDYKGGPLRYTSSGDVAMQAMRQVVNYVEQLAMQHGRLLEECPQAKALARRWGDEYQRLL